jgi:hypothetical protein
VSGGIPRRAAFNDFTVVIHGPFHFASIPLPCTGLSAAWDDA